MLYLAIRCDCNIRRNEVEPRVKQFGTNLYPKPVTSCLASGEGSGAKNIAASGSCAIASARAGAGVSEGIHRVGGQQGTVFQDFQEWAIDTRAPANAQRGMLPPGWRA